MINLFRIDPAAVAQRDPVLLFIEDSLFQAGCDGILTGRKDCSYQIILNRDTTEQMFFENDFGFFRCNFNISGFLMIRRDDLDDRLILADTDTSSLGHADLFVSCSQFSQFLHNRNSSAGDTAGC